MTRAAACLSALTIAAATLAGCTQGGGYPSLLPRGAERQGFAEPAAPAPAVATPDPALDARIAALHADSARIDGAFAAAIVSADRRVVAARGAASGSDAWLDAQTALGELDVARADAREPLTSLEQLAADRAVAGLPPYPALATEIAAAQRGLDAMAARSAALQARVAR